MTTKEETYTKFESGWYKLIDTVYTAAEVLPFCAGVQSVERRLGMLSVKYITDNLSDTERYIVDAIAYKIERDSSTVCEVCGKFGRRRTNLPTPQPLCTSHYAIRYSEVHSAPSVMASQEPHSDY